MKTGFDFFKAEDKVRMVVITAPEYNEKDMGSYPSIKMNFSEEVSDTAKIPYQHLLFKTEKERNQYLSLLENKQDDFELLADLSGWPKVMRDTERVIRNSETSFLLDSLELATFNYFGLDVICPKHLIQEVMEELKEMYGKTLDKDTLVSLLPKQSEFNL